MVRISRAKEFLATRIEEADYFGYKARRDALLFTPLVHMNRFRVLVILMQIGAVLLTWINNWILDVYLVTHPLVQIAFAITISVTVVHYGVVMEFNETDATRIDQHEAWEQTQSLTQSFVYNSILSGALVIVNGLI